MICYVYNCQCTPPAPFVHVNLRSPDGAKEISDLPGQLDTAADRSVIPAQIVEALGLSQMDQVAVMGLGGRVAVYPTYLVQLQIRQLDALEVEVLTRPEEPLVLLGRDIRNRYRISLDGPQLAFEIG